MFNKLTGFTKMTIMKLPSASGGVSNVMPDLIRHPVFMDSGFRRNDESQQSCEELNP
jgi:hypothetical protein